jgi:hypothetical protein
MLCTDLFNSQPKAEFKTDFKGDYTGPEVAIQVRHTRPPP